MASNLIPDTAVAACLRLIAILNLAWGRVGREGVSRAIRQRSSVLVATPERTTGRAGRVSIGRRRAKTFLLSVVANHGDGEE
jgi:hypothetical protein